MTSKVKKKVEEAWKSVTQGKILLEFLHIWSLLLKLLYVQKYRNYPGQCE